MDIEQELIKIQERNKKVELDKAWELSWSRRISIALMTYVVAEVWLLIIREHNSWAKALVPTFGYILSTLSLRALKSWWSTERIKSGS